MAGMAARAQHIPVTGQVRDSLTAEPLEGAAIRIFLTDSTLVTGTVAGSDGRFRCKVAPDRKYLVNVSFLGYVEQWRTLAPTRQTDSLQLGRFDMAVDAVRLQETKVSVQQLMIVTKGDTIIYNADAFKPGETDLLKDLFKKIPGIEVEDGKVTVNGKPVSRILINGEDFFGTDASKTLENLPAYMVQDVKAYEKEDERNRITRFDDGQREQVLDVTLKRKYLNLWLANAAAGYGTKNKYIGRLFANRFDDNRRISAYGAASNTNDRFQAKSDGDWNQGSRSNGTMDFTSGGIDMLYKNRKHVNDRNYVKLTGNASITNEVMTDKGGRFAESILAGIPSFSMTDNSYRTRNLKGASSFHLDWRPSDASFVTLSPTVSYGKNRGTTNWRSGTWNENPYTRAESPLDSIQVRPSLFGETLVNSNVCDSKDDGNQWMAQMWFWANYWVTSDGCNFTLRGDLNYTNNTGNRYEREDYKYYQPGQEKRNEFRNIYTRHPSSFASGRFFLDYVHVFKHGLHLRGTYGLYKGYLDNRGNYRYRLDGLGTPWNDPAKAELGLRPDDQEALNRAFDLANSYDQEVYGIHHWIETGLNWNWKNKLSVFGQFGLQPYTDVADYRGHGVEKRLSKSYLYIAPAARIKYTTDSLGTVEFAYNNSFTGDYMLNNLIDVTDDTDPLNIRKGNPNLKGYYTNNFEWKYDLFTRRKQSYNIRLNHSYKTGAVSYLRCYDPATGITVTRPENIEGERNWNLFANINLPLDEKNRWNLSANLGGSTNRNVEYSMLNDATESARDVVRTYNVSPSLHLKYQQEKLYLNCSAYTSYTTLDSQLGLNEQAITRVGCSPYAQVDLPWNIRASTQLTINRLYGYADPSMNRTYTLWDFQINKTCLRQKNLTLSLTGKDILGQLKNYGSQFTSTGRRLWWNSGTIHYVMFSVQYKLYPPKKS